MTEYLTYADIVDEIEARVRATGGSKLDLIKMVVNSVYLTEVIQCDPLYPLYWLTDFDDYFQSVAPAEISAITKAADGVFTTSSAHGFTVGDIVSLHSIGGMTELNDRLYYINSVPSSTTFKIGTMTTNFTTYTSGGYVTHRGRTLNALGKNVKRILYAGWNNEGRMTEITPKEIESKTVYHMDYSIGLPNRYYFGQTFDSEGTNLNQLIWYPAADAAYRLRYWFEARCERLINDDDVPLLPPEFHQTIVAGALTRLAEYNVQVENPKVWAALYSAQLTSIVRLNNKIWTERKEDNPEFTKPYMS